MACDLRPCLTERLAHGLQSVRAKACPVQQCSCSHDLAPSCWHPQPTRDDCGESYICRISLVNDGSVYETAKVNWGGTTRMGCRWPDMYGSLSAGPPGRGVGKCSQ